MTADEELTLMRQRLADLEKQLTDAHRRLRQLEDNCWLRKKYCGEPCSATNHPGETTSLPVLHKKG